MLAGISLANKCQLLFGCAVVLILAAALSVPWVRTRLMVEDFQIELARQVADAWMADRIQLGTLTPAGIFPGALDVDALESETEHDANGDGQAEVGRIPALRMSFVWVEDLDPDDPDRPFLAEAYRRFRADPTETEYATTVQIGDHTVYRYARAIHESEMRQLRDASVSVFSGPVFEPQIANPLRAMLIVDRTTQFAESQLLRS